MDIVFISGWVWFLIVEICLVVVRISFIFLSYLEELIISIEFFY